MVILMALNFNKTKDNDGKNRAKKDVHGLTKQRRKDRKAVLSQNETDGQNKKYHNKRII